MGTLEQEVLDILRAQDVFNIAALEHGGWTAHLEEKHPKGPRGGLFPTLRSAKKMQEKIAKLGPDALAADLLPRFMYAAERWQQMTEPAVANYQPYLRYVCTCLPDSRPSHVEKHGLVLPIHHPFWDTWYPLNGLGCLCTVMGVSESLLARRGWHVSENQKFQFSHPDDGFDFNIGKLFAARKNTGTST